MKEIMKKAHEMTREMVEKYGVDYQAQLGLCIAYLLEIEGGEKMAKTTTWITPRGAKIELTTEEIKTETINLDGHEFTVDADDIRISELKVNGEKQSASLRLYQGENVLHLGYKKINGKDHPLMVAIPVDVYESIWAPLDKRRAAKLEKEIEVERKYQAHYNEITKAMEE